MTTWTRRSENKKARSCDNAKVLSLRYVLLLGPNLLFTPSVLCVQVGGWKERWCKFGPNRTSYHSYKYVYNIGKIRQIFRIYSYGVTKRKRRHCTNSLSTNNLEKLQVEKRKLKRGNNIFRYFHLTHGSFRWILSASNQHG